jgi:hypothetical protein
MAEIAILSTLNWPGVLVSLTLTGTGKPRQLLRIK